MKFYDQSILRYFLWTIQNINTFLQFILIRVFIICPQIINQIQDSQQRPLMEPLSYDQKPQKPIVFSFEQENNSQEIFVQENYLIGNQSKTKYQFIKNLIEKYDQKPKRIPEKMYQSGSKLREESPGKKFNSAEKPPLPPKPHRQEKQKKQEKTSSKGKDVSLSSTNSEIKTELEKSHQELLERFKSPLQNGSKPVKKEQEKEMKSENLNNKGKVIEDQQKEKSAISTQNSNSSGSIPLVESVLMSNQQSARSPDLNIEIKESPVRELSQFLIPEGEIKDGVEKPKDPQEMKQEPKIEEEKQQNEQKEDEKIHAKEEDGEKMTIFWLCFIFVLVVMLCFPTDWQRSMNGF